MGLGMDLGEKKKSKGAGFFSRFFGGSKTDNAGAQNVGSNSANAELVDKGNSSGKSSGFQKFAVSEANDIFELGDKLGSSFKLGFKDNSSQFDDVMISLDMLNASMSAAFDDNVRNNQRKYQAILMQIDDVIDNCANYLSTHAEPKTPFGKRRKELVTQIRTVAQVDRSRLESKKSEFDSMSGEEQAQMTVAELFRSARTVKLHTDDFEQLRESKATGGQASDVMKLSVNGDNVRGVEQGEKATHYFKFEDEIDLSKGEWEEDDNGEMKTSFNASMTIDNIMKRYSGLPSEDEKFIREWSTHAKSGIQRKDLPLDKLSAKGQNVLLAVHSLVYGGENTFEILDSLELNKKAKSINMSRRNVATSRVADLLGMGRLVAKSENVEITDNNNRKFSGNLMESAIEGEDALKLGLKLNADKSENLVEEASKGEGYQIEIGATGGFQRDMCNLQILDCICGQVDRHGGNIIVSRNENGDLDGLQGIDNDASFGLNKDNSLAGQYDRHIRSVVNRETGELTLPYVDDKMAKAVESLEPSALEYVLKDLLSKDEIKACIVRFKKIKQCIQKTRQEQPERFLENEDDWNDDTAQKMVNDSWGYNSSYNKLKNMRRNDKINATLNYESYFGKLMVTNMMPSNQAGLSRGIGANPKIKKQKK